ncbi:hypothetical protein MMC11_003086 [Xylographa trunciseda]|nr:hypothetical protein [Xylographa trunciseda]
MTDEKPLFGSTFYSPSSSPPMLRRPHARATQRALLVFLLAAGLGSFILLHLDLIATPMSIIWPGNSDFQSTFMSDHGPVLYAENATRVPLEAHIMSKCPDARDCLRDLVVPAVERIVDKVDFRLSFIGSVDPDDTIQCKHGQTECLGNILSLCANDLYSNDTKVSLGFTTCMIMDYTNIPKRSLVENCALEYGVDFDLLNDCLSEDGKGLDLLEASVKRSKDAGVKYSCTVRLDDKFRCIRDGGVWKDCEGGSKVQDLVNDVERLYKLKNQAG